MKVGLFYIYSADQRPNLAIKCGSFSCEQPHLLSSLHRVVPDESDLWAQPEIDCLRYVLPHIPDDRTKGLRHSIVSLIVRASLVVGVQVFDLESCRCKKSPLTLQASTAPAWQCLCPLDRYRWRYTPSPLANRLTAPRLSHWQGLTQQNPARASPLGSLLPGAPAQPRMLLLPISNTEEIIGLSIGCALTEQTGAICSNKLHSSPCL